LAALHYQKGSKNPIKIIDEGKKMTEIIRDESLTVGTSAAVVCLEQSLPQSQRSVLILTNISTGGQTIYLSFSGEAVANKGIPLSVGGFHAESIDAGFRPSNNQITAIASAVGATLAIHERIITGGNY